LTQKLSHPSFEHEKEYEVTLHEPATESQLEALRSGVELPSGPTSAAKVKTRSGKVYITIHEGKKHQVRRMFDAVGLSVTNLKRVRMGNLTLPTLAPGAYVSVQKKDIL
jgi:pseudouridine synthase